MPSFETAMTAIPPKRYGSLSYKEASEAYMKRATCRYAASCPRRRRLESSQSRDGVKTNSTISFHSALQNSDYSILPPEILQIVARHAAAMHIHEEDNLQISPDLFKMRLVCRSFSGAAGAVFISMAQQAKFSDYRILRLPPKSANLLELKAVVERSDPPMSPLVTSIVYHITSAASAAPDYDDIGRCLNNSESSCDCENMCILCDPRIVARRNLSRLEEQHTMQYTFAKHLHSSPCLAHLRGILEHLSNLKTPVSKYVASGKDVAFANSAFQLAGSLAPHMRLRYQHCWSLYPQHKHQSWSSTSWEILHGWAYTPLSYWKWPSMVLSSRTLLN